MGVRDLCEQTGLSANAIRFHLRALQRAGGVLSAMSGDHKRPGRPPLLYRALRSEAVDLAATYRMLAGLLAEELGRSSPVGSPARAGREWARGMTLDVHSGIGLAHATAVVVSAFREAGFEPAVDVGPQTVALYRCPFRELAAQQIGASSDVRLSPVLDGSGPCLVRLGGPRPVLCRRPISSSSSKEQIS